MVFISVAQEKAAALQAHLKASGVLLTGLYQLRLVTHLDLNAEDIALAVAAFATFSADNNIPIPEAHHV